MSLQPFRQFRADKAPHVPSLVRRFLEGSAYWTGVLWCLLVLLVATPAQATVRVVTGPIPVRAWIISFENLSNSLTLADIQPGLQTLTGWLPAKSYGLASVDLIDVRVATLPMTQTCSGGTLYDAIAAVVATLELPVAVEVVYLPPQQCHRSQTLGWTMLLDDLGSTLHEFGHTLGLPHSFRLLCGATFCTVDMVPNHPTDVMGYSQATDLRAGHRHYLGWLQSSPMAADGDYPLVPLSAGAGTRFLTWTFPAIDVFWSAANLTAEYYPGQGVLLHVNAGLALDLDRSANTAFFLTPAKGAITIGGRSLSVPSMTSSGAVVRLGPPVAPAQPIPGTSAPGPFMFLGYLRDAVQATMQTGCCTADGVVDGTFSIDLGSPKYVNRMELTDAAGYKWGTHEVGYNAFLAVALTPDGPTVNRPGGNIGPFVAQTMTLFASRGSLVSRFDPGTSFTLRVWPDGVSYTLTVIPATVSVCTQSPTTVAVAWPNVAVPVSGLSWSASRPVTFTGATQTSASFLDDRQCPVTVQR